MRYKLYILLLLTGCGVDSVLIEGDPLEDLYLKYSSDFVLSQETSTSFDPPCVGLVKSENPIRKLLILKNLRTARRILDAYGVVPAQEFCVSFEGTPVQVDKDPTLNNEGKFGGEYVAFSGIWLGSCGDALVHELLHLWDWRHGAVGTVLHEGWDYNDYNAMSEDFHLSYAIWCKRTTADHPL